ncbi:guanine nucleotide-binding protein-like 1 [Helicoverpa zea]|uniref:guanine nucleotide-binding protein-like 1 n=1 Tax=Helicoverpa zea TaxID=7113 RepID=UPI001F56950C|nr:guanine nucleotide-binding protein-like 1 [Helicoverpa zea]XP_049696137.1 guanine nucleotide-binding protein-like 1 isoform X1 [Helicoverpa armigera]XP_049696138.1 guanine nucleotide-binding protein-like 1 isoform X2 [Helicoverpa armigera]XP_049696139.1 guanine nucleotide-binding protein-like 1 isoform X3 [Helicoverpa armigera]XP_049696140.1 guanine nucleotide-binding protein-like 1 isoform X4 [Helicoverpa armigera]
MPQARRKTPFSGKAKKQQLQSKKQNKTLLMSTSGGTTAYDVVSVNYQPNKRGGRDTNRYALKFYRENDDELRLKKEDALKELRPVLEKDLEVDPADYFPTELSFPKRPPWDFNMSPAQLDAQEQRYFKNYVDTLQASEHWKDMSYFELNLETWRQLWRVLEMCDILLLIVDVRYAGMMFPPSLYSYIQEQNKHMILVLNKIDLVPPSVAAAWKQYLTETCPALTVLYFTSCVAYNLTGNTADKAGLQIRRRKGKQRMCVEGATKILEACKEIVKGEVDLSSWEKKIKEETDVEFDYDEAATVGETILEKPDTSYYSHERYKSGVLSIGCVGQPNVGKSSLLNALMGRSVVSVSKTPGHTKHFQTIYLTPQVRLCDCPGLVFPSKVPRPIQILMGSYPIAQLREPYTAIRYIAERLDLPKLLRIEHPEGDDSWSPRDICDGWAKKRSYFTAKAARLDTYRAANSLLRMALDGRICLWLRPPGFAENREKYENCEEIKYIKWVRAITDDTTLKSDDLNTSESDGDRHSDSSDADDDSSDDDETAAIANKFAALAGDD